MKVNTFKNNGYEYLPGFLPEDQVKKLLCDVRSVASNAIERDFIMPGCGTPRYMKTLGGTVIRHQLPSLMKLFRDQVLKSHLEKVTDRPLFYCTHPEEFAVVNFLTGQGQTHGWHLDDPDIALVICLEAPEGSGGAVEMIQGFEARQDLTPDAIDRAVSDARAQGNLQTLSLNPGDAYILHAATVLHRVTPLSDSNDSRIAINFAYSFLAEQTYGDSADLLYGQVVLQELSHAG